VPQNSPLTPQQLHEFADRGVIRLAGLLSEPSVRRARAVVLDQLAKVGLWRDGAWRLDAVPRPQWPDHGLKTSKVIGNRHEELAALIADPSLRAAVTGLLEGRSYAAQGSYKRPQVLFTLPNADTWEIPDGWHTDSPRLPSNRMPGVQLFTFLEPVEPGGGGTVVIAGSHRLMNLGQAIRPRDLVARLRANNAFPAMLAAGPSSEPGLPGGVVDGVPLQLTELTGEPGDAWLMDLLQEVAQAWGWR
jgi:hypothetical protein